MKVKPPVGLFLSAATTKLKRRRFFQTLGLGVAGALAAPFAWAEENRDGVLYPRRATGDPKKFSWYDAVIASAPPLRHERGNRWPLITWEGFSFQPQAPEYYRELLRRGLTQHIRLEPGMIETALALQRAGSPVIAMEGGSGAFPATLAGDATTWAHQLDEGYKPADYVRPCPSIHLGWARFAEQLRGTLRQFRERGAQVDAVWADWENDPLYGGDRYQQAKHCRRCREILPPAVLASPEVFMNYTSRKFYELFGTYYAAPVLEFYPKCSVTDWLAQPSTPEHRQPGWSGSPGHVYLPPMVTAWNPTAYGAASWVWKSRLKANRRDQEHVDQVYANLLLRQVSLTSQLTAQWAPEKELIPWVARWVSEAPETEFPVMSRERYREVLRHLWLRGASAMQVFSPRIKGYEEMALPEVLDAVAVYDEMLAFRDLLNNGEVLNREYPGEQDDGVVWSGLRHDNHAVVRAFKQGGGRGKQRIRLWGGEDVEIEAPAEGVTYKIEQGGAPKRVAA